MAEARREVEKLTQDIDECVDYINEIKEQVALAQDAAESAKEELDSLKADLDEKSDKIQEFRQLEVWCLYMMFTSVLISLIRIDDAEANHQ